MMLCGCLGKKKAVDDVAVPAPKVEESVEESSDEEEEDSSGSSSQVPLHLHEEELLRRALGHLGKLELARAWRSWDELAKRRALVVRALARLQQRDTSRGWQSWREWQELHAHSLERMSGALRRLRSSELSKGLATWAEKAAERAAFLTELRIGFARLRSVDLHRGWRTWCEFGALTRTQQRILAHAFHRELAQGLRAWTGFAADRDVQQRALRKLVLRNTALGWRTWMEMAEERAAWLGMLGRARELMQQRERRRALRGWTEYLRAVDTAGRVLGRGRHMGAARGFGGWLEALEGRAAAEAKLERARSYYLRRGLVRALALWRDENLATLGMCLRHLRARGLSLGWRTWQEMAVECGEFLRVLRRGVGVFANRKLMVGLATWREVSLLLGRFEEVGAAALTRLITREKRRGWAGWVERARELELMYRTLGRARHRQLGRSLMQWTAACEQLAEWEERRERVRGRMSRRGLVAGLSSWRDYLSFVRAARHLKNRHLSRAWRMWVEKAAQRASALKRIRRAGSAIAHAELNLGWVSWREHWTAATQQADKMGSALRRLCNRELVRGWEAWLTMAAEGQAMRRCIVRAVNRALTAGWSTWQHIAEERASILQSLRHSVGRMANRRVATALAAWQGALTLQQQLSCLRRLLHLELLRGFNSWAVVVADRVAFRKRVERLLPDATPRQQQGGWLGWLMPSAPTLQAGFAGLRHRDLRRGWLGWLELSRHRHAQLERLRWALTSMTQRQKLKGWRSWQRLVQQMRLLRRAVGRGRNQGMARGFGAWRRVSERQQGSLRRRERVRGHIMRRGLVAGLSSWRDYLSFVRAARHLKNQELSRAWRTWAVRTHQILSTLSRIERSASRMLNRRAAQCFSSWLDGVAAATERATMVQRAATRLCKRELVRGWTSWCYGYEVQRAKREAMQRCLVRALNRSISRGFLGWIDMANHRSMLLQTLRRGVGYMLYRRLATNLAQWRRALTPLREAERVTIRLVALAADHLVLSSCARAFITWQDEFALLWRTRWLAVYPLKEPRRPTKTQLPSWAERLFERAEERARAKSGRVRPPREPRKPSLFWSSDPEASKAKRKKPVVNNIMRLPPRRWGGSSNTQIHIRV